MISFAFFIMGAFCSEHILSKETILSFVRIMYAAPDAPAGGVASSLDDRFDRLLELIKKQNEQLQALAQQRQPPPVRDADPPPPKPQQQQPPSDWKRQLVAMDHAAHAFTTPKYAMQPMFMEI